MICLRWPLAKRKSGKRGLDLKFHPSADLDMHYWNPCSTVSGALTIIEERCNGPNILPLTGFNRIRNSDKGGKSCINQRNAVRRGSVYNSRMRMYHISGTGIYARMTGPREDPVECFSI